MDSKKLFKNIIVLIFFILIVNFLANKFYWYSSIWYFDMIMHTLGGFWLSLAFMYVFPIKNAEFSRIYFIKVLLFVLSIGIAWEIYEILVNDIIAENPFNVFDTVSDLFFDLSGGVVAMFYVLKRIVFTSQNTLQ